VLTFEGFCWLLLLFAFVGFWWTRKKSPKNNGKKSFKKNAASSGRRAGSLLRQAAALQRGAQEELPAEVSEESCEDRWLIEKKVH